MKEIVTFLFAIIFMAVPIFAQAERDTARLSIAMLNHMATETEMIRQSMNNRIILGDIRHRIENTINPAVVDVQTQGFLNRLLDALTGMQLTTIQRDRLQIMHENEQAQAMSQALPNPLYLLTVAQSRSKGTALASIALMTVDSFIRGRAARGTADINFLLGNLDLEAQDLTNLANLTGQYFNHMIEISRRFDLDVSESLALESIRNFVELSLDDNLERRRQWLESNRALYAHYGPYWLALASVYFELGRYSQVLEAIRQYENIQAPIFRRDFAFAEVLPKAILAANAVYGYSEEYQRLAARYLQMIVDNTSEADWALRYFAAQMYIRLAALANRDFNLQQAFSLLVSNITHLSRVQDRLVQQFLSPIEDGGGVTRDQIRHEQRIATELRRQRRTELPPLHSGLVLNYQVLFLLKDELNLTPAQRAQVNGILRTTFLKPQFSYKAFGETYDFLPDLFNVGRAWIGPREPINAVQAVFTRSTEWRRIALTLPAAFLTADSTISFNLSGPNHSHLRTDVDYSITDVRRRRDATDIHEFTAGVEIPLDDILIIGRASEYNLVFTIRTHYMTSNVTFTSPAGSLNFEFAGVEFTRFH